jgi:hypothetical protein
MIEVHIYASSGEAYDDSQCNEAVHDGAVLWVPDKNDAAVLLGAWPTSVRTGLTQDVDSYFHCLLPGSTMEDAVVEYCEQYWINTTPLHYTEAIGVARALLRPTTPTNGED